MQCLIIDEGRRAHRPGLRAAPRRLQSRGRSRLRPGRGPLSVRRGTISSPASRTVFLTGSTSFCRHGTIRSATTRLPMRSSIVPNRLPGGYRDKVSSRLEFLVPEISTFRRFAAGQLGFELGGFLLEIDAHKPGCEQREQTSGSGCSQKCRSRHNPPRYSPAADARHRRADRAAQARPTPFPITDDWVRAPAARPAAVPESK